MGVSCLIGQYALTYLFVLPLLRRAVYSRHYYFHGTLMLMIGEVRIYRGGGRTDVKIVCLSCRKWLSERHTQTIIDQIPESLGQRLILPTIVADFLSLLERIVYTGCLIGDRHKQSHEVMRFPCVLRIVVSNQGSHHL